VVSSIKIGRVTDRTTKFDGFEGIRIVKRNKFGNEVGALRLEPKMEKKKAGVEGTACVHEAAELNRRGSGTQVKSNVRKAIIDGDRHRRKDGGCGGKVSRKRLNMKKHESGFL
jgi:hypothetical protein